MRIGRSGKNGGIEMPRTHFKLLECWSSVKIPSTFEDRSAITAANSGRYFVQFIHLTFFQSGDLQICHSGDFSLQTAYHAGHGEQLTCSTAFRTLRCSSSLHSSFKTVFYAAGITRSLPSHTTLRVAASSIRTYYGHISDHKMAPHLEPYFKK